MAKLRNIELENGALTSSMNVKNKEFKELRLFLSNKAKALDEKQKLQIELFALQVKIEDYLNSQDDENHVVSVGDFLRLYIEKLGLKQNKFAKYLGLNPTNFNKILSGNRKVNFELSFMLSQIFSLDPKVWISIQVKNDYLKFKMNEGQQLKKYNLEDLIRA